MATSRSREDEGGAGSPQRKRSKSRSSRRGARTGALRWPPVFVPSTIFLPLTRLAIDTRAPMSLQRSASASTGRQPVIAINEPSSASRTAARSQLGPTRREFRSSWKRTRSTTTGPQTSGRRRRFARGFSSKLTGFPRTPVERGRRAASRRTLERIPIELRHPAVAKRRADVLRVDNRVALPGLRREPTPRAGAPDVLYKCTERRGGLKCRLMHALPRPEQRIFSPHQLQLSSPGISSSGSSPFARSSFSRSTRSPGRPARRLKPTSVRNAATRNGCPRHEPSIARAETVS